MSINANIDGLVERFCLWLGRYGSWSRLLDRIASVVCPSFLSPLLLPAAGARLDPWHQPLLMAGDPGDPTHSLGECSPPIFHGMHGAPCAFHGGSSDNKFCPPGTTTGLWWRFNIPGIGNVYYVDCCGVQIEWTVWCRWAKEQNWCAGRGNNIYTCTITLLHSELHVGPDNFADPNSHVLAQAPVVRRPPAPPPSPTPRTYVVVKGDFLSKIAKKFYGDAGQWQKIYQANKAVIGPNPDRIFPGQKLVIPD
jgi:LysM repeat protein